jgi:hypothetical protein
VRINVGTVVDDGGADRMDVCDKKRRAEGWAEGGYMYQWP